MQAASEGPLAGYRQLYRDNKLQRDPQQELAAEKLQALHNRLRDYEPGRASGWKAFFARSRKSDLPPQGLYIYGDVGRGKSMLMDLFFGSAPVARKRRVHFHAFMQEVHAAIHRWRQQDPAERGGEDDPIPPLARRIADGATLLCFDEFQVTNVADAMILGRLFEKLFSRGVVVVATSNRAPDELYLGGLNRELFLPFIALFKQKLDLLHLDGGLDYRLARFAGQPVYFSPLGGAATAKLDAAFRALTDDATPEPEELEVQGRKLVVPAQAKNVARFGFDALCRAALGPADYLTLASHYHSLLLDDIPALVPDQRDAARRFVTLIDTLYEAKTKLICSAAVPPEEIYAAGDAHFDFRRTASRLREMQSRDYMALPHVGGQ